MPLLISENIWEDLFIDFVVRSPHTHKRMDFMFVAIFNFTKMVHFIPYKKTNVFL
jgi:hypothetical protein